MSSSPGSKDGSAPGEGPGDRSEVRRPTPAAPLLPASAPSVTVAPPGRAARGAAGAPPPPARIPLAALEQRVVQGARRPGDPPPAPPPPSARALPRLPKPDKAGPTPMPPPPVGDPGLELDSFDIDVDDAAGKPPSDAPRARAATPPTQLPAICTYGRFEILGRIAFGGMAEIFLGRESSQAGASRLLAIKRILPHVADDPAFVEMFLDEARLAIQLNHPQICHIYEFGELEGTYFIAMEWIHGAPLGKVIRKARTQGGIPPETGARIIANVAEALHYAHRARDANGQPLGIVHRDVSPHNVMVSYEGQVKLLDFGIAKAQSHTTKTQAGVVKGKFSYMSPQQCLGKHIDARADVFALGICLYETLTGESLYHRQNEYETMRAVIEDPVPSIRDKKPDLPVTLDAIVQKALQKEPADRFRSAAEMQAALEDWLATTGRAVTTARVGELMESLFESQILAGPLVDSTPFGQSFRRRVGSGEASGGSESGVAAAVVIGATDKPTLAPPSRSAEADDADEPALVPRRRPWVPIAAVLGALGAAAAIAVVAIGGETAPAPADPAPVAVPIVTPTEPAEPAPVEATPAPPLEGHLVIDLRAPGATVRVGDRELTETELGNSIALPPGSYLVHVEHEGHRPWDREVEVAEGEVARVQPTLVPLPRAVSTGPRTPAAPPGTLSINTRPWSKVWVGSRLLGTTPIGEASVPSGSVRLRIVDRDGRSFTRSVRVAPGATASVFFDLDE